MIASSRLQTSPECKFLLVEDDETHALMVKVAFEEGQPVTLEHVRSGEEALARLAEDDLPDVVLLDLRLPGLDGFDVLTEIRQMSRLRHLPVVILTTSNAELDHERARDLGANSYVVKPVGFDAFCTTLRDLKHYWSSTHARNHQLLRDEPSPQRNGRSPRSMSMS